MITENEILNEKIKYQGISDEEFLASEIKDWQGSASREKMLVAERYYKGEHDILKRKRTAIGKNGNLEEVENLPNNMMLDNRFARLLDQKKNYLLSKPLTIRCENLSFYNEIKQVLDAVFYKDLKLAGEEALLGGISFLYPYINILGKLRFKVFSGSEICPFWKDSIHSELDCVARVYSQEVYEGKDKKIVNKVDVYRVTGLTSYEMYEDKLVKIEEEKAYIQVGNKSYNWGILPIIPIKVNQKEIPLISRIKELQDGLNLILSDFMNNMEENIRSSIIVLKNYDGTDLGELRKNLSSYGAIKTRTQDGASGGVDVLRIEVNSENYRTIYEILNRSITQNARGFDSRDEKMSGNPNQLNIRSMYSDLDLDANDMESELQASFITILDFVKIYLMITKSLDFTGESVEIIFNRDILINENEAIENCVKSIGLISSESIMSKHPWVNDLQKEVLKMQEKMSVNVSTDQ